MPEIEIRDETWARLKQLAVPLEDSADDVITRLLDQVERGSPPDPEMNVAGSAGRDEIVRLATREVTSTKEAAIGTSRFVPRRTRAENTDRVLTRLGLVKRGTAVVVHEARRPAGQFDPRSPIFRAYFASDGKHVIWEHDGQEYSISDLARTLAVRYGVRCNPDSENGYRVFCLQESPTESLEDLRKRVQG